MVEYLSIHLGQRFSRYPHYVFGHFGEPPKTSSAGIFALDDFPVLTNLGKIIVRATALYQHYVFGYVYNSPKTSSVGIVTLNGLSHNGFTKLNKKVKPFYAKTKV